MIRFYKAMKKYRLFIVLNIRNYLNLLSMCRKDTYYNWC